MFANAYTLLSNGDKHYKVTDTLELHEVSKRFNEPFKNIKTFPLADNWTVDLILEHLKTGKYAPSYIKPHHKERLKDSNKFELVTDYTRFCIVTETPYTEGNKLPETKLTDNKETFSEHYKRVKELEYYRFHDDAIYLGKLSRLKDEPTHTLAVKHNGKLCVYYCDKDTAYIYYNQIDPELIQKHLSEYRTIVWGVQNQLLQPIGIILYPETHTTEHLTYIRPKKKNLLQPIPKTKTDSIPNILSKVNAKEFKLSKIRMISARRFITECLLFHKMLSYYESDGILILLCEIDRDCDVYADDDSLETFKHAKFLCQQLGGDLKHRPRITAEEANDPKLDLWAMFLHDKSTLDLSGSKKREIRRIYNKIQREHIAQIKIIDEPSELEKIIETEIIPLRAEWAKNKVKRDGELKLPVYYHLFVTYYYRNFRPEIRELLHNLFIGIYVNGKLETFVFSEKVCKNFIYNTEAASLEGKDLTVKHTREILAVEEFRYWYDKNPSDGFRVCSGFTKIPGLKKMKCNMHPSEIYKI